MDFFLTFTLNILQPLLAGFMPYYSIYIVILFNALTIYLLIMMLKSNLINFDKRSIRNFKFNSVYVILLFFTLWFFSDSFVLFTDENLYLEQSIKFSETGQIKLLLSESIMTFFFGIILYLANLTMLKAGLLMFLTVHFLLWKLILEKVFKLRAVVAAIIMFFCAIICMSFFSGIISYMVLGYALSSFFAYISLKSYFKKSDSNAFVLLPFIALLAVLFRQECFILFPLILIYGYRSGIGKIKILLPLLLAVILALPILYVSWQDELHMAEEKFDRKFVSEIYSNVSGIMAYPDNITSNESYMLNIVKSLSEEWHFPKNKIIDISENIYNTPNPSIKNIYYNLRFRNVYILIATLISFVFMVFGIVFLKPLRRPLIFLSCMAVFYFAIFYLQKYSVGGFERFYFYLFPLYGCFFVAFLRFVLQEFQIKSKYLVSLFKDE